MRNQASGGLAPSLHTELKVYSTFLASLKLPKDDGAWWMGLTCWSAGALASLTWAWEPLLPALATVGFFAAAQAVRTARLLWKHDPPRARNRVATALIAGTLSAGVLVPALLRAPHWIWWAALALPAAAYSPFLIIGRERHPAARVLASIAIAGLAPVAYACATTTFGAPAAMLWAALGGYFILGSIFVMARFRRSRPMLWVARVAASLAFAAAVVCSWIAAAGFMVLAVRTWAWKPQGRIDPKRTGNLELAFGCASAVFVVLGIWLL